MLAEHPDLHPDPGDRLQELLFALDMARGQFKLMFVRCNYSSLRSRLIQHLQAASDLKLYEIQIPHDACSLFHALHSRTHPHHPEALSIAGLDDLDDPERLLKSANPIREELRKSFPCPVLLWVNDTLLQHLVRLVPDFESWGTTYEFDLTPEELRQELIHRSDRVFQTILQADSSQWLPSAALTSDRDRQEIRAALQDLQQQHQHLDPELAAHVQFLVGRNAYERPRVSLDTARQYFQRSLSYWESQASDSPQPAIEVLEKQAVAHLHLGLVDLRESDSREMRSPDPSSLDPTLQSARQHLQTCAHTFDKAGRPDATARVFPFLGDTLNRLRAWEDLRHLAYRAIELHKTYGDPLYLAVDYGFLAKVAAIEERWYRTHIWADRALQVLTQLTLASDRDTPDSAAPRPFQPLLGQLFRLLLVTAQHHLNRAEQARDNLDIAVRQLPEALQDAAHQIDPHAYLRVLESLRSRYISHQQYLAAFHIKQQQHSIEQQYGFRAFIGAGQLQPQRQLSSQIGRKPYVRGFKAESVAPEILASPRQQDINRLIERIARPDCKLVTLYGPSGAGKSSLIDAGLVPALRQANLGTRDVLPVVLRVYDDWRDRLWQKLAHHLNLTPTSPELDVTGELSAIRDRLIAALQVAVNRNLFVVPIFDQFEEFFFVNVTAKQRYAFYEFLDRSFEVPYVKVLLSLREDYLHYLLDCDRQLAIDALDNDILHKDRRYYLSSFSPDDTRHLIRHLTETRPHLDLEPGLIDAIVRDLAAQTGDVRPIELQIVGAQLQQENISTLTRYRQLGENPKQELVERFLEDAVGDCGPENEVAARHLLYRLTDKRGNRPIKSYSDLAQDLDENLNQLDLILEILVKSGLVSVLPEAPEHRFQLVHDYLVSFIRLSRERADSQATANLRETNLRLSQEKAILQQLTEAQEHQRRTDTRMKWMLVAGVVASFLGAAFLGMVANLAIDAREKAAVAEVKARTAAARGYLPLTPPDSFLALLESLRAGDRLTQLDNPSPDLLQAIVPQLQQSLEINVERNRIEAPSKGVLDVSFSPDGSYLATVGLENTLDLWDANGEKIRTIQAHDKAVTSLSISPDSQTILTGSDDNTAKLWSRDGEALQTYNSGEGTLTSVGMSPDGETFVTADADGVVKLWNRDGAQLSAIAAHGDWVLAVRFHPNGEMFATASRDGTVKLWNLAQRSLQTTLTPHNNGVTGLDFSPDGRQLVTVSADGEFWLRSGENYQQIRQSRSDRRLLDVRFSPNGDRLVTTAVDGTVRLWNAQGTPQRQLSGHRDAVWSASFSPDGRRLVTASSDTTVRVWQLDRDFETVLDGGSEEVWGVAFSPDGTLLASANLDGTVQLWHRDGRLLRTLRGHRDRVSSVSFSPDGSLLASTSTDKTVRLWDVQTQETVTVLNHDETVKTASFSPDGRQLATAGSDGKIIFWRVKDGIRQRTVEAHSERINSLAWHPDGTRLVSGSNDRTLKIWQSDGTLLETIESGSGSTESVNWVSFSPDGKTIASASSDNTLKLWKPTGTLVQTLEGHTARVNWVSFSPDGTRLVSGSDDRTVRIWQRDGTLVEVFEGHEDSVLSVGFHPQEDLLVSASKDGTVRLWLLPTLSNLEALLVRGCDWMGDYLSTSSQVEDEDKALCQER